MIPLVQLPSLSRLDPILYEALQALSRLGASSNDLATAIATVNATLSTFPTGSGLGAASRVTLWSSPSGLTSDANLVWNGTAFGVGTASPNALLDVRGTMRVGDDSPNNYPADSPKFYFATATTNVVGNWTATSAAGNGAQFTMRADGSGAGNKMATNNLLGLIGFRGRDDVGFAAVSSAKIQTVATEPWFTTNHGTKFEFYTTPNGSTSSAVAMTIDQSGFVGIGTTGPNYPLHLSGATDILRVQGSGANVIARLGTTATANTGKEAQFILDSSGSTGLTVQAINNGVGLLPILLNPSGGNVGIGTTAPNAPLHVLGTWSTVYGGQLIIQDTAAIAAGVGGKIVFGGKYTGTTQTQFGFIECVRLNATDPSYAAVMHFGTREYGGSDLATRMTIDNVGNVGIGTTAPGTPNIARLEVAHPGTAGVTSTSGVFPATFTLGSTNVHDAGGHFNTAWLGARIIETSTATQPSYVIMAVTTTDITLNVAYGGTTGSKSYTIYQFNNAHVVSNLANTLDNGMYMHLTGGTAIQGIYIDSTISAANSAAGIAINTYNGGDAMHIGVECPGTGTPTPYGIGVDMNRANYGAFAGTGIGVLNFSTGGSNLSYGFNFVNAAAGLSPGFVFNSDGNCIWMCPSSANYPTGASSTYVIRVNNGSNFGGSEIFNVYSTGQVTANQPRANAYHSAVQNIPNNTATALTFDTNITDNGVHSGSTNNTRFTAPGTIGAGWYSAVGQVTWNLLAGGGQRQIQVWKNAATQLAQACVAPNAGGVLSVCVAWEGALAAGDYVEFYALQDSGAGANTVAGQANTRGSLSKLW